MTTVGFQPVTAEHPVERWNRQAAPDLVFGMPAGWRELDLARFNRTDVGGTPAIAGEVLEAPGGPHRVVVYRGSCISDQEFTYVLANMAQMVGELEQGRVIGVPAPLLVCGERAFMARYAKSLTLEDGPAVAGMVTEVWVAHGGHPYRLVLSGPAAGHDTCVPYFLTMLATLEWEGG